MIKEIKLNNDHVLRIYQDESPESPREWDNLGKMICWHNRYNLGDKKESKKYSDAEAFFCSLADLYPDDNYFEKMELGYDDAMKLIVQKAHEENIILPLYLYDHSGLSISTGSFGDHWDSGQVGYIYASKEDVCNNWRTKRWTDEVEHHSKEKMVAKDYATEILKDEVETYNQYLCGDIYGFKLVKLVPKTWINKNDPTEESEEIEEEEIDSCWGFYGSDVKKNGMLEHLSEELTQGIEF